MRPDIYWIPGPWSGRLAILARPRGGDWLEDEVAAWKQAGVSVVVSALTPEEEEELELVHESRTCAAVAVEFWRLVIVDRDLPESGQLVRDLIASLLERLNSGASIGIHCRQAIGRSGMLAACALVAGGMNVTEAWQRIEKARGRPVPDTPEQREWVERWTRQGKLEGSHHG